MIQEIQEKIENITDDELFLILECVSNEVKRRNKIMAGPSVRDLRNNTPEQNLKLVLDALATFGVTVPKKP